MTISAPASGLQSALDLFEFGVEMHEQTLRRRHPMATDDEIEAMVQAWLLERPGAPRGDYAAVPARTAPAS